MTRAVHRVNVPVSGGDLAVGVWDAEDSAAPTILAIHGVTSSHLAWEFLAEALPGVRIVAPDLRGRGRSNDLVGPAGMAAHAADLAAVSAALGLGPVVVVAHSMGAFVAVAFAARHPDLVSRLVLVDGGLPLGAPAGLAPEQLVDAILGPTAARLNLRFASDTEYLDFWRAHPAFVRDWTPELERYLAYDLVPAGEEGLRPATAYLTTVEDTIDMNTTSTVTDALVVLDRPATLITVPRGLQDEEPGLYPEEHLARLLAANPRIAHDRWDGFNHYTVVLSAAGAARLARVVTHELALAGV
ncbi:MAG: alpha/beta fold hydrolase [Microbacterium sp.]|uniref:alpha/beta hydrolase n=1 Tax=Microbacterium sp. TaxID=51671 RepID=UPI001AC9A731|nr:alpha/beta fold hydrolase [Microbacterium sp.]MBN9176150.1 alpha/beta fold hydrolase [Microbacterium sp.]